MTFGAFQPMIIVQVLFLVALVYLPAGVLSCSSKTPPKPVDCEVSQWSQWQLVCKKPYGNCSRSRSIIKSQENKGKMCPNLTDSQPCPVCPVNCQWGDWLSWSNCTTCGSGGRSRYRTVYQPAAFDGETCGLEQVQVDRDCVPHDNCTTESCNSEEFTCGNGEYLLYSRDEHRSVQDSDSRLNDPLDFSQIFPAGRCIPDILQCNGDKDCDDDTDEKSCSEIDKSCDISVTIPEIRNTGQGYDILHGEYKSHVLDNTKYKGTCNTVRIYDGNIARIPWNIMDYTNQVETWRKEQADGYSSSREYWKSVLNEKKTSWTAGISFDLGGPIGLSLAISSSTSQEQQSMMRYSVSGSYSIFVFEMYIQVATFITRDGELILKKSFVDDVNNLPAHFDFKKYSDIFKTYGTSYISGGKLGGKLRYVFRYANKEMEKSGQTIETIGNCIGAEMGAMIIEIGGASVSNNNCESTSSSSSSKVNVSSYASSISTNVMGGTPSAALVLSSTNIQQHTKQDYKTWAGSISERPTIISYKLKPITDLLPYNKQDFAKQTLKIYLSAYDTSNCKVRCMNDGELVVMEEGRKCTCVCPAPYFGNGCQYEEYEDK